MKKIIIMFPFQIGRMSSGSAVRPLKMLTSFRQYSKDNNIELIEIHGEFKVRSKIIRRVLKTLEPTEVLFCYMENSTMPFWLTDKNHIPKRPFLEIKFFNYLKKNHIPFGLFYRDVYWKFDDYYPLKGIKRTLMRTLYRAEHYIFSKYASIIFLPSLEMNKYALFPTEKVISLPPGGENLLSYHKQTESDTLSIIYVGGISERYGIYTLLDAVKKVYEGSKKISLHLVCRIDEYNEYKEIFVKDTYASWLNIYHLQGDELREVYQKANVAIIPIRKNVYNDFAVPVKLFEYLSYGLPIISTNCNEQRGIIEEDELGIVVNDDVDSLANGITRFFDCDVRNYYSDNVRAALLNKHLWKHRIKYIVSNLSELTSN